MDIANARRLAALISVGLCALTWASSASAATGTTTINPFGCRASVARVTSSILPTIEPIVSNKSTTPCLTDSDGVGVASALSTPALAFAGPAGAYTFSSTSQPGTTGAVAPGAGALVTVDGVTIPTTSGVFTIVGPVEATASYACVNGNLALEAGSTIDVIYINGAKKAVPPGGQNTLQLGGGSYITFNETIHTSTSLTQRIVDIHLPGLADIVVGEAQVTKPAGNPCAGTSGPSPTVNPCPAGSTFDPVAQVCEIVLPGGGVIVISRPYEGPTGGTVISLSQAHKLYRSPCLYGKGPNYVIVGTNHADRINGTSKSERILGLGGNDRIAGQGGDDCIDGGAGNDKLYGGNGDDRMYGGTGNDRISVQNGNAVVHSGPGKKWVYLGNGNDHVYGGPGNEVISVGRGNDYIHTGRGNDQISTGDGNDTVITGPGNDKIWVGNGKDHIWAGKGHDRIYAPGADQYVHCTWGGDLVWANGLIMNYATSHGCNNVHAIPLRQLH